MSWVRLDDQFADHPKIVMVGPLAAWLHVKAIVYCGRYLTDGFVPKVIAHSLISWNGSGVNIQTAESPCCDQYDEPNNEDLISMLISAGLWETIEGGYNIHDYLDWNPSSSEIKEKRSLKTQRINKWRSKHGSIVDESITERACNTSRNTSHDVLVDILRDAPVTLPPSPIPSPSPSQISKDICCAPEVAPPQLNIKEHKEDQEEPTRHQKNLSSSPQEVFSCVSNIKIDTKIGQTQKKSKEKSKNNKPKTRTKCPASIDETHEFATTWNIDKSHPEFAKFLDYHVSKGNLMSDWSAAWRTWLRNSERFQTQAQRPGPGTVDCDNVLAFEIARMDKRAESRGGAPIGEILRISR